MSRVHSFKVFGALVAASLMLAGWTTQTVRAADEKPAEKKEAKERAKARGVLPDYYAGVVDGTQRDKIYEIQKSYATKLDELKAQMKDLTDKRDAEIKALLTPEQKAKVEKAEAEGKAKAAANRAKRNADKATPAKTEAPAAAAAPEKTGN
jgi:hypothetical protein